MKRIIAGFCGIGKTTYCKNSVTSTEVECWGYSQKESFPNNYIDAVFTKIELFNTVCVSTDPRALVPIIKLSIHDVILVYPDLSLFDEYMARYVERGCPYDFIGVMYKHWHEWIKELHDIKAYRHVVLTEGQYLSDYLDIKAKFV